MADGFLDHEISYLPIMTTALPVRMFASNHFHLSYVRDSPTRDLQIPSLLLALAEARHYCGTCLLLAPSRFLRGAFCSWNAAANTQ